MRKLTEGEEGRLILYFTMPMLLGNVFQQLYSIVDSIIVGNYLGKAALAAVGASYPIIFALISLVVGITMGTTIVIAQFFGAKQYDKVKLAVDTMYIFLFFASVLLTVIGLLLSKWIFRVTRLPEEVVPMATTFMNTYLLGLVFFFGYNGTSAALRGIGDSKTPLYFLIYATLMNLGLVFLFVAVFHWGIAGAAWATILSQSSAFFIAIWYLNKKECLLHFSLKNMRFDRDIFMKSLRVGLPSGIQQTFVSMGMLFLYGIVNSYGTDVSAAYSVAGRIDSFALLPAMNFSMALSTFTGQNLGANQPERVVRGLRKTIVIAGIIALMVTLLVIFTGHYMMGWFTKDPEVIRIGWEYLVIVSSFYLVFTLMFLYTGVMRGAGDTLVPMFISIFSLWIIRIPMAYLLSGWMGEKGIWWSIPAGWIVGTLVAFWYYRTGKWKNKVIVRYPSAR